MMSYEMTYDEVMADQAFDELCMEFERVGRALEKMGFKEIDGNPIIKEAKE